ncbi:U32 family peptidase [Shewanella fidelis]|uniref:Ubiquinone biosynthesis protein UbiV n=1 Tax=Shewanella fidelis TaxID=173509 RepID=A0AAW8NL46_9GAMM|nr:U32 family peptidase [Shewanella fidelis]MDR8522941.1 U32 family peptidase [Shewanella fidelis]MDW4811733.1 U32 family peptidase [Shewanella fidelis]MDW4815854.1 U32 family peptidase [Shewanella fidelis]MDW4819944.1 U32 family peptidase [Shewanella fidelis]MDW4824082.1 U32 family peptidase [Shewanella fidelis]
MKTSLGPLQYCWEKQKVNEFYQQVAQSNIPLVYLGETVCSRRRQLKFADYFAIAQMLKAAGKQVVLSTLALLESPSEYTELKKQVDNGEFIIEANDMGAVQAARELKLPFVCGPSMNNYNFATLKKLHQWGMQRFVMPIELSKEWLAHVVATETPPPFEVEVFGHGYLPLAHSARCFTARQQGLQKDDCQIACLAHPKGLLAQTMDEQPLLRLNGIQTQSASLIDLSAEVEQMRTLGVDYFRVSPHSLSSIEVAETILSQATSDKSLTCNGYWHQAAGFNQIAPQ